MALIIFLMVGTIPGTRISVSPTAMLFFLAALSALVGYWLFRQRPVRQIHQMKRAYHQQLANTEAIPTVKTTIRRQSLFVTGLQKSLRATGTATRRHKVRAFAHVSHQIRHSIVAATRALRPLRTLLVAGAIVTTIAAHEIATWAQPHLKRTLAWLRLQTIYSVKGTMLSAHRWSSLSKNLLSSPTSPLSRCSSALKRGKSLLTRAVR